MIELLFQFSIWAYPGLAVFYGFWSVMSFGAKNTLSAERERSDDFVPGWALGFHFGFASVAFFLAYLLSRDVPIGNDPLVFAIRMIWGLAFLTAVVVSVWHYGAMAWRSYKEQRTEDDE